jgi:adenosylcobinamide-phosphate synthase
MFLPWHLASAYVLDLLIGDPAFLPHPIRWIGRLIGRMETIFNDGRGSPFQQRFAGFFFWLSVMTLVVSGTMALIGVLSHIHHFAGAVVMIWLTYATLATRSLHQESSSVARALRQGNLPLARERLSMIVSRDTSQLSEEQIVRALVETVSENISDGIVAPLFYLAIGGPILGLAYKAVNTMDSMVGYKNDRYLHFGWYAARADDAANLVPARLSGLLLVAAAACLRMDWRRAWKVMARDARRMKSPNAGFPEAAAAGALDVELGGTNVYFGTAVEKPRLGDPGRPLTLDVYREMVVLMYVTSLLAFVFSIALLALLQAV